MPALITEGTPTLSGTGFCTIDSTGSDGVFIPVDGSYMNPARGWIAMRVRFRWAADASTRRLFSWRDGAANGLEVIYNGANQIEFDSTRTPGSVDDSKAPYTFAAETTHNIVAEWDVQFQRVFVDGAMTSDNNRARGYQNFDTTTASIFRYNPAAIQWGDGDVFWLAIGGGTLSYRHREILAARGDTDLTFTDLPPEAQMTMRWTADDFNFETAGPLGTFQ